MPYILTSCNPNGHMLSVRYKKKLDELRLDTVSNLINMNKQTNKWMEGYKDRQIIQTQSVDLHLRIKRLSVPKFTKTEWK